MSEELNYTEFIAATLTAKAELNQELLWSAFQHFDVSNSGEITEEDIKEVLKIAGREIQD